jgi:hypothetical protein
MSSDTAFGWIEDGYETFGWIVVEGMPEQRIIDILGQGAAVQTSSDDAWDSPAWFAIRMLDDTRALIWDDAIYGLDQRVPDWLSADGRCTAVGWGMTQSYLTVSELGSTTRRFDPMLRGPLEPDDEFYDDVDPEDERQGAPLPVEEAIDWAASGGAAGSLRMIELLTGVAIDPDPMNDPRFVWYACPELPAPDDAERPPLLALLHGAPRDERAARLRAGLITAARITGLEAHPPFVRALADADELLRLADPPGTPMRENEYGDPLLFTPGDERWTAFQDVASRRLKDDWEWPLGQRIEPVLYPTEDGPGRRKRDKATPAESAELGLARATAAYLFVSSQQRYDWFEDDMIMPGLQNAAGDRWADVESAILAPLAP